MNQLSPKDVEDHVRQLEAMGIGASTDEETEKVVVAMTDRFIDTFEPRPECVFGKDKNGINRIHLKEKKK